MKHLLATVLAQFKGQYERAWEEAEKEYQRAIELKPGYAPAHQSSLENPTLANDANGFVPLSSAEFSL